ncbi:hypothetical protein [Litoreibacter roseus]|uniref:Uncharacterized protein n=1 Tax=Litoreibacter roseus TaxID=2601869 RepID=A0A6N6JHY4_9RHOB|nr:hypothetical protein [Litoreibacter roseus]GFE65547.1 hypothetical protein KIN_26210 [Litoreibacter roseus]
MSDHGNGPSKRNDAINGFALAAGILTTLMVSPQLWIFSQWLGRKIFLPQWGYDLGELLVLASFGLICWMSISVARFGWSSTLVMGFVLILSKTPIF